MLRTLRFCHLHIFIKKFLQFLVYISITIFYVVYDWIAIIIMAQVSMNITL